VFLPEVPHLIIRREFAARGGSFGAVNRGTLGRGERNRRLLIARKLEYHAGNIILRFRRQRADGFKGLFEKFGHA